MENSKHQFKVGDRVVWTNALPLKGRLQNDDFHHAKDKEGKNPFIVVEILSPISDETRRLPPEIEEIVGVNTYIIQEGFTPVRLSSSGGKTFTVPTHWLMPT